MKELKKYLKTKGLWSFWFLVLVAAVVIYVVAQQTGLAIEEVNNGTTTSFMVNIKNIGATKTPVVPTNPVTR